MRDIEHILAGLRKSPFRRRFRLGPRERAYLEDKGLETIMGHARAFIGTRLTPANPRNDGKQTPMRGHPVFIAQHATATCCRSCLAKWHGIAVGRALSAEDEAHVLRVIERWLRGEIEAQSKQGRRES